MTEHHTSGCGCSCGKPSPIDILKNEHRVIEVVLSAIERGAATSRIDVPLFRDAIDFLRNFADGCHHAKEENELFPRLEAVGIPRDGGPIGCMLDEHTQGRALIRRMVASLDGIEHGDLSAVADLRAATTGYVELLRKHIWKEDNVLFEMANRALSHEERRAMRSGFEKAEESEGGHARHDHYVQMAQRLFAQAQTATVGA